MKEDFIHDRMAICQNCKDSAEPVLIEDASRTRYKYFDLVVCSKCFAVWGILPIKIEDPD